MIHKLTIGHLDPNALLEELDRPVAEEGVDFAGVIAPRRGGREGRAPGVLAAADEVEVLARVAA